MYENSNTDNNYVHEHFCIMLRTTAMENCINEFKYF
jgi:hypothetical protein